MGERSECRVWLASFTCQCVGATCTHCIISQVCRSSIVVARRSTDCCRRASRSYVSSREALIAPLSDVSHRLGIRSRKRTFSEQKVSLRFAKDRPFSALVVDEGVLFVLLETISTYAVVDPVITYSPRLVKVLYGSLESDDFQVRHW